MSTNTSLQKTLGISLTVGIVVLWLLGVAVAGLVAQYEMNEVFDSALEETAQRILPLAVTEILSRESEDRKSTRLNSSHVRISYAVLCLKKKTSSDPRRLYSCRRRFCCGSTPCTSAPRPTRSRCRRRTCSRRWLCRSNPSPEARSRVRSR